MGAEDRGLLMLDKVKVSRLLAVTVAGTLGKLLRVSMLREGVLVIVGKFILVTETERN